VPFLDRGRLALAPRRPHPSPAQLADRRDVAGAASEVHEADIDARRARRLVLGTRGL
jgi:hypothetical protein